MNAMHVAIRSTMKRSSHNNNILTSTSKRTMATTFDGDMARLYLIFLIKQKVLGTRRKKL